MKVLVKFSFALIIFFLLNSCTQTSSAINEGANHIANLECNAIALREQRYSLADKIRFTQDTLLKSPPEEDSLRLTQNLKAFNKQKEILLQRSLSLADTIHKEVDSLMQHTITTPSQKELFKQALDSVLKQRGCLQK